MVKRLANDYDSPNHILFIIYYQLTIYSKGFQGLLARFVIIGFVYIYKASKI